jgi:hypothetical protein
MQPSDLYGEVALDFKVKGERSRAIFHYKYYTSNDSIEYIDIEYTNPKLQSLIESNSKMMENVDCYIRNLLLRNKAKESLNKK